MSDPVIATSEQLAPFSGHDLVSNRPLILSICPQRNPKN